MHQWGWPGGFNAPPERSERSASEVLGRLFEGRRTSGIGSECEWRQFGPFLLLEVKPLCLKWTEKSWR